MGTGTAPSKPFNGVLMYPCKEAFGILPEPLVPLPFVGKTAYLDLGSEIMNLERLGRITVEEGKCGGRPCIRGHRIRVSNVLELLGAGASIEEILADYAFLEREDILAAIDYAAYQTDHVVLRIS